MHKNEFKVIANERLTYKGMMYSGIPNLASTFGYTNASWTLGADLTSEYVCRVINHMKRNNYDKNIILSKKIIIDEVSYYLETYFEELPLSVFVGI